MPALTCTAVDLVNAVAHLCPPRARARLIEEAQVVLDANGGLNQLAISLAKFAPPAAAPVVLSALVPFFTEC